MANEVKLPRLGWDMEEGVFGGWLKQDGDFVRAGDMLFAVEGDKAVQEIEALDSGYLLVPPEAPQKGQIVAVGTLLGYLITEDERSSFKAAKSAPREVPVEAGSAEAVKAARPTDAPQDIIVEPTAHRKPGERIKISPLARRMAREMGIEWQDVKGTGLEGRISARDVQGAYSLKKPAEQAKPVQVPAVLPPKPAEAGARILASRPMSSVRRSIAAHMNLSARTVAPVTLTCEVDATRIVALRNELKDSRSSDSGVVPSYNDILAKIAAAALLECPEVNASMRGDEILQYSTANIGVAVDTDRGLLVPVLRDVQTKSLRQIARESAALIEKARTGRISMDELQGGTFTITNLGMYEIDVFTPIINLPECAILGVGRIVPKQVVVDAKAERIAIRLMMFLSLTFDHRLVDGAPAARFLQRVKQYVERPYLWLVGQ